MLTMMLLVLLTLTPLIAHAGDVRCTTRWDEGLQIHRTECTDGSRAVSRWDTGLQHWQSDVVKAPQGDQPPRGWPTSGKPPR
jgi:hypothetical protein